MVDLFGTYLEGGSVALEVVESAKVSGLKPGFFVVSLGVCPEEEVHQVLGLFQAIYPDVYAKPVEYQPSDELPAQGCPRLAIASEQGGVEGREEPVSVREGKRKKTDEGVCGYEAEERMISAQQQEEDTGE